MGRWRDACSKARSRTAVQRLASRHADGRGRAGVRIPHRPRPASASAALHTEEVMAAVDTLHPSSRSRIRVSMIRPRWRTAVDRGQRLRTSVRAGPAAPASWRGTDLSSHAVKARVEGRYERAGSGANVLGRPTTGIDLDRQQLSRTRDHAAYRAGWSPRAPAWRRSRSSPATTCDGFGALGSVEARFVD